MDSLGLPVHKADQVPLVLLDTLVLRVLLAQLDLREEQDQLVILGPLVHLAEMVFQDPKVALVQQEQPGVMVDQVVLDTLVPQVLQVVMDSQDSLDH
jgi:hypothetical protein